LVREGGVKVREGLSPSLKPLPSPLHKGRGIQGKGLLNNLKDKNMESASIAALDEC